MAEPPRTVAARRIVSRRDRRWAGSPWGLLANAPLVSRRGALPFAHAVQISELRDWRQRRSRHLA
jgi:hypothetical protein